MLFSQLLLVFLLSWATALPSPKGVSQDAYATTDELITGAGYPAETHYVTTEDGYILTVHRIPSGLKCSDNTKPKIPVIVQHGNLCSSADWVYMGPKTSLGFYLADQCYDVWLPNSRGNTYSKNHRTLSVKGSAFWDFSFHEMGIYDTPAEIDYILEKTGQSSLYYMGHSQGTSQYFVFASERPEYSSKVKLAMNMGPGAYMSNVISPSMVLAAANEAVSQATYDTIGSTEVMPHSDLTTIWGLTYCSDLTPLTQITCAETLFAIAGRDSKQLDYTKLPVIYGHLPAGTSSKLSLHFVQNINSGDFKQFNYGKSKNQDIYGTETPPSYNLSAITIPTSIHYGENDWITVPQDAQRTAGELQNLAGLIRVPYDDYNHFDFMWAKDNFDLLYSQLVTLMQKYE